MKMSIGTLTRTILLVLALINQALTVLGYSPIPIEDDQITNLIAMSATVATSLLTWWKNQSFTKEAIEADKYMNDLKARDKYFK